MGTSQDVKGDTICKFCASGSGYFHRRGSSKRSGNRTQAAIVYSSKHSSSSSSTSIKPSSSIARQVSLSLCFSSMVFLLSRGRIISFSPETRASCSCVESSAVLPDNCLTFHSEKFPSVHSIIDITISDARFCNPANITCVNPVTPHRVFVRN